MSHLALVNPPTDVQHAVAAAVNACHGWKPTLMEDKPAHVVPRPPPPSIEAQVCGYINDPLSVVWPAVDAMVLLAIIVVLVMWVTRLHHLPGFRQARRAAVAGYAVTRRRS